MLLMSDERPSVRVASFLLELMPFLSCNFDKLSVPVKIKFQSKDD